MSWKAWYFVNGFVGLGLLLFAMFCATQISPWATGIVVALFIIPVFDKLQDACWAAHMEERRAAAPSVPSKEKP